MRHFPPLPEIAIRPLRNGWLVSLPPEAEDEDDEGYVDSADRERRRYFRNCGASAPPREYADRNAMLEFLAGALGELRVEA